MALAPGESNFLVSLGTEYIALERYAEARTTFQRYLDDVPNAPDAARVREVIAGLGQAIADAGAAPAPGPVTSLPPAVRLADSARRPGAP